MRIVIGLGGNALLRRGEIPDIETQRRRVRVAAEAIASIARRHEIVVTHGNGPQVGLLALQAAASRDVPAYPLDVLGAESEGLIGYLLDLELANALPGREVATLLTEIEVDPADPAFGAPDKPIGPAYAEAEARRLAAERNWTIAREASGWRRVVASPQPRRIRQLLSIGRLMAAGVVVVCAGGGGIPVAVDAGGRVHGVEAVIDKDRAAALLAESIGADRLLLLTDVAGVFATWPSADGGPIRAATPAALRRLSFAAGSMAPKVAAACRFVERTGRPAAIGAMEEAEAILARRAGTLIRPA